MSLIIFNADDFGYSRGVNLGIIEAHVEGILTSTTLMPNMHAFDEAITLANAHPELGVGIHLTLTAGAPVSDDVASLVNEDGKFHPISFYENGSTIKLDELYKEWKSQIVKILDAGLRPSHLDSHHHVHTFPLHREVFMQLAKEYRLPVRGNFPSAKKLITTAYFHGDFDGLARASYMHRELIKEGLFNISQQFDSIEVMCHPAYVDSDLARGSSYTLDRTYILEELKDPSYKKRFQEINVKLATFRDLR